MLIYFIKDIQDTIIPPVTTLFTHKSIHYTFRLICNNVNLLRVKFHQTYVIFGAQSAADDILF